MVRSLGLISEPNNLFSAIYKDIGNLSIHFIFADAVTTISNTVKEQMLSAFPYTQKRGIDVIYQPIKPVKFIGRESLDRALIVGRACDPNKNSGLAIYSSALSDIYTDVYGPEDPTNFIEDRFRKFVDYKGLVNDKDLNISYNTHNFGLITSRIEGIGLSGIEMIVSGNCIPIVSNQMSTALEFYPKELLVNPTINDFQDKIKEVINNRENFLEILKPYKEKYTRQFSPESVAYNIVKTYEKTL